MVDTPVAGETPPPSFGERAGRASAPTRDDVLRYATSWTLDLPPAASGRRYLEIEWAGDVAHLEVDGVVVADRFWDGTPWIIGLDAPRGRGCRHAHVAHRAAAPRRIRAPAGRGGTATTTRTTGRCSPLDAVRLVEAPLWREQPKRRRRAGN